jgi:hypothetical protein
MSVSGIFPIAISAKGSIFGHETFVPLRFCAVPDFSFDGLEGNDIGGGTILLGAEFGERAFHGEPAVAGQRPERGQRADPRQRAVPRQPTFHLQPAKSRQRSLIGERAGDHGREFGE